MQLREQGATGEQHVLCLVLWLVGRAPVEEGANVMEMHSVQCDKECMLAPI
jgi:hypothetical protein